MNPPTSAAVTYLRGDDLSVQDRRDLEAYYAMLRAYFDIPAGEPVFPADATEPDSPAERPAVTVGTRRCRVRNAANHPWRVSVRRSRP